MKTPAHQVAIVSTLALFGGESLAAQGSVSYETCFDLDTGLVASDPFGFGCPEDGDILWTYATSPTGNAHLFWNEQFADVAFLAQSYASLDTDDLAVAAFCDHLNDPSAECQGADPLSPLGANRAAIVRLGVAPSYRYFRVGNASEDSVTFAVTFEYSLLPAAAPPLPAVTGGTAVLNPNGSVTVTGTGGGSVTFPPGTSFAGGASVIFAAPTGATRITVVGATLPAGATKSISISQAGFAQQFAWGAGGGWVRSTYDSTVCVNDSAGGFASQVGASGTTCAGSGGSLYEGRATFWGYAGSIRRGRVVTVFTPQTVATSVATSVLAPPAARTSASSIYPGAGVAISASHGNVVLGVTAARSVFSGSTYEWPKASSITWNVSNLQHTDIILYDDSDGDSLPDLDEVEVYATDPNDADTDVDGVEDGDEVALGTDPNDATSVADPDADGDGLRVRDEIELGTDPYLADSDGDGFADGQEAGEGTDPLDGADNILAPLCPCDGGWRNHGAYVSCVARAANSLRIASPGPVVSAAARSNCGR